MKIKTVINIMDEKTGIFLNEKWEYNLNCKQALIYFINQYVYNNYNTWDYDKKTTKEIDNILIKTDKNKNRCYTTFEKNGKWYCVGAIEQITK